MIVCNIFKSMSLFVYTTLLTYSLSVLSIAAGPQKGVMQEFRQQEEYILRKEKNIAAQRKILERNLENAVRALIRRRLHSQKEQYYRGLTIAKIAYENPSSAFVYYVKYKDFLARLTYEFDPKHFIHQPKHVKFIRAEAKATKSDTRRSDTTGSNATGSNAKKDSQ